MIKINCFEVKAITGNNAYFGGSGYQAYDFNIEYFTSKTEAEARLEEMKKETEEKMNWCDWWMKEYMKDENFTITKVTKEI